MIELLDGHVEEARRRTAVAMRLDPGELLGGAGVDAARGGRENREKRAARIFETALHTPIGSDGKTLAHSLMKLGAR